MSRNDSRRSPQDAGKPRAGQQDRLDEDDKEGVPVDDAVCEGPSLIDTVSDPDLDTDPAEEIDERGEPFEGNHA